MAGQLNISGNQTGVPSGTNNVNQNLTMSDVEVSYSLTAVSSSTTVTPVAGVSANALLISPPPGNTVTITLKGNSGDTGISIDPTDPTLLALPTTNPTIIVVLGAGTLPGPVTITLL